MDDKEDLTPFVDVIETTIEAEAREADASMALCDEDQFQQQQVVEGERGRGKRETGASKGHSGLCHCVTTVHAAAPNYTHVSVLPAQS